ncbi:MAG: hypothetical protein ACYTBS_10625 [Planctomycetota bacterium]|jgi:hypothetical protein
MMITVPTITSGTNAIVLALTPFERWQAVRRLGDDIVGERSYALVCAAALVLLTVLLIVVSLSRRKKDRALSSELFRTYADRRGLSHRERTILMDVARRAKVRRSESIFTLANAFNLGAARITDQALALNGAQASRSLRFELTVLREKLGLKERVSGSIGSDATLNKPSSRQISVDKKLQIIRREHEPVDIEATVIKNDDIELAVRLSKPLEAGPGQECRLHYYYGVSVWEFDASVVSCEGEILVLAHSYDVRFINRRRFFRAVVNKPALIAGFPFTRKVPAGACENQSAPDASTCSWAAPEFVPATVTEMGGPGLRIEVPAAVEVGSRVLVVVKMSEESAADRRRNSAWSQNKTVRLSKIVEDIAEVRRVEPVGDEFSLAVELTGLSDSDIDELIRETNSASMEASGRNNDMVLEAAGQAAI